MNFIRFSCAAFLLSATFMFGSCSPTGNNNRSATGAGTVGASNGAARIAYVDIDSFEAHYESLKKKKEEFKSQQEAMAGELQRSAEQMQSDYAAVVRKEQAGTLTQREGEDAQKRLGQMQQSLETRKAAMTTQFQDKLEAFQKELHTRMDAFLTSYTKEHNFDYVLSYSRSNSQILYANKGLNITDDVIKGMNDHGSLDGSSKDTAKSK